MSVYILFELYMFPNVCLGLDFRGGGVVTLQELDKHSYSHSFVTIQSLSIDHSQIGIYPIRITFTNRPFPHALLSHFVVHFILEHLFLVFRTFVFSLSVHVMFLSAVDYI